MEQRILRIRAKAAKKNQVTPKAGTIAPMVRAAVVIKAPVVHVT
jgi:hypothetical protein